MKKETVYLVEPDGRGLEAEVATSTDLSGVDSDTRSNLE